MRDVAEGGSDREYEIKAYLHLGETLQQQQEHMKSVIVLKRLLQVAWIESNLKYEMIAYEMIGRQYFYLSDLHKACFYIDRTMRGKFENATSKVRELSLIQYHRKLEARMDKTLIEERSKVIKFEDRPNYAQIQDKIDRAVGTIYKIQKRSKEGYYRIGEAKEVSKMLEQTKKQQDGNSPALTRNATTSGGNALQLDMNRASMENMKAKQSENERIKKILNIYAGHDLKFDRCTKIRRVGTPIADMQSSDLPSPVATKNSRNLSLLPYSAKDDAAAAQLK